MSITPPCSPLSEHHSQPPLIRLPGEHIDYVLFGVFPAAIEQDVLIALAPRANDADEEEKRLSKSYDLPLDPIVNYHGGQLNLLLVAFSY